MAHDAGPPYGGLIGEVSDVGRTGEELAVYFPQLEEEDFLPISKLIGTGRRSDGPRAPYWSALLVPDESGELVDSGTGRDVLDNWQAHCWPDQG